MLVDREPSEQSGCDSKVEESTYTQKITSQLTTLPKNETAEEGSNEIKRRLLIAIASVDLPGPMYTFDSIFGKSDKVSLTFPTERPVKYLYSDEQKCEHEFAPPVPIQIRRGDESVSYVHACLKCDYKKLNI